MSRNAHVELVRTLTARALTLRYRSSALGWAWALLTPLATVVLLSFVFGQVLGVRWTGGAIDAYPAYLFCGLVVHGFIADSIVRAPTLVLAQPNYVHHTPFPLTLLAWVQVCELLVPLAIGTALLVPLGLWYGFAPAWTLALVPLVLAPLVLFGVAFAWLLGSLGVYLRDLGHTTGLIATGMLFFSPVLYPLESVSESLRPFYQLNPTTQVVENLRAVMLNAEIPTALALGAPLLAAALFAWLARHVFRYIERGFADVL